MKSESITLEDAISLVEDHTTIAVGGFNLQNKALAAVRELVRQSKRHLTLICGAPSSIDADILVGAGCVDEIIVQSVSLERFGSVGPAFRRRAQEGDLRVVDADQGAVNAGLWAARSGLPSQPTLAALGADFERVAPDWFRQIEDPFSRRPVVAVKAMRPDWAFLHAAIADEDGRAQQLGSVFNDRLIAAAAKRVVITTEQIVPSKVIARVPERTFTWAHNTVATTSAPFGAHPTACHGRYPYDAWHLREYAARARTAEGFDAYREVWIDGVTDHTGYLEAVGVKVLAALDSRRQLVEG